MRRIGMRILARTWIVMMLMELKYTFVFPVTYSSLCWLGSFSNDLISTSDLFKNYWISNLKCFSIIPIWMR